MKIKKQYLRSDDNFKRQFISDINYFMTTVNKDKNPKITLILITEDTNTENIRKFIHNTLFDILSYIWFKIENPNHKEKENVKKILKNQIGFNSSFSILEYDKSEYLKVLEMIKNICFLEQGYPFPDYKEFESIIERMGDSEGAKSFAKAYILKHNNKLI